MASVISGMISSCTSDKRKKAKGKVVLRFADACAAAVNQIQDFLCHKKVELLLVSATVGDPNNGNRGVLGPAAYLESQMLPFDPNGMTGEMTYGVTFTVVDGHGIPGAIIVKNHHATQFHLKSVTIDNFPGEARIHFDCNSWVYNTQKYSYDRIFFANNSYLPKKTPEALRVYRQDELRNLRGDGVNRKLEEWDRIYSYGLYNDLGNPDRCLTLARPVLGGSAHLPYPRRCKTGRPPTKTDSKSESLSFLLDQKMYVPCDEHVNQNMEGNFFAHGIKILVEYLLPSLTTIADEVPIEFDSFEGLLGLYNDSAPTNIPCVQKLLEGKNFELFKACLTPNNGQPLDAKTLDMFKSIKPTSYIDVHDKFLNPFKVNHTLSINDPHYDMNSLELSKGNPLITKNDKPVEKKLLGLASNNEQSNEPKPSQSFKTTMMPDSNKCHDINSSGSLKPKFNSIISQNITDDTSPSKTSKPIQSPNNNDLIDNPVKSFNMITSPSQRQSFVTNSLEHSKVIPTKLIKDITKPNVGKNHKEKHIDSHNSSCIPIISQTHEDKSLKPTKVDHSFNNDRTFETKPSNSYKSIPMQNCTDCNDEKSSKLLKANVSPNNDQPNMNKLLEPSKTCNTSSKTIHLNVTTPLDTSDVHNMPRNDSYIEANLSMPFNYISTPNIDHPPADNSSETLYSTIPPHINDCNEVKTSKLSEIFPTPNNVIKEGNHTSEPSKDLHMLNPCHLPEFIDTLDPCKILQNNFFKFPTPKVIQEDLWAWRTDEEFARETLAGVNPVIIRRLREFPPTSKLDSKRFGDQNSRIKAELVEMNLDGLSAEQAVEQNRVFIVDHHDMIMPYLRRINSCAERAIYATRTFLFLKDDGTLKPLAIELSLPHPDGDSYGVISSVYTPAGSGVEASIWSLAKTYAIVNDSGAHQLITHWLRTHAAMEPFAIAANRQLSVMHPISKLLRPHLGDIISTNAIYRQALMNAGGLLEFTGFPGKHSMEMSAAAYRSWNFVEQGLPQDLLKRGMAVEDSSRPHNLRLLIADYPYAVDGLEIWSAVESWVREYCDAYYADEGEVQGDEEVQAWWKEARDVGHCDLKNEPWWPQMKSVADLASACTTIIWVASAMHQAVSLGQYDYAGYVPNRPTITRRFMPAQGSPEYEQLKANPEKVFLQTITSQPHAILGISLIRMLSAHDSCMPQPATNERTTEREFPLQAFNRFRSELTRIQKRIQDLNADPGQKNRTGPAKMPYTLLSPHSLTRIADSLIQSDGRD